MSSPLFTRSFLNENELEHLRHLSGASDGELRSQRRSNLARRQYKREIRRGCKPIQGSDDPHHATVSRSFIRPGSASSTTEPRSPREAATPTELGHGQSTPVGVVPCTPPFPAGSGGGERQSQIREVKKLEVTVVVNITETSHEHVANTQKAISSPTICIAIQQGQAREVRSEECGWAVTGINVVVETGC